MLESKRRAIIFITISLLLATAAGFFALKKVRDLNSELGGMTKVYVAADNIPSRTLIKPNQVMTLEIPNRFVNEDSHVTDEKDFYNKVLVVPLSKNDIITKQMIKPVSNIANENNRLVAIPHSDRVSFDETLESLDRIDIIVSHDFGGKPVTEIFMEDVSVAYPLFSGKKFKGVVVEVSAENAPKIIHMENYADSMRILKANVGKGDENKAATGGEKVNSTATDKNTPAAAPPPASAPVQNKKEAAEKPKAKQPAPAAAAEKKQEAEKKANN
ncbi:SAF domain-containing protein [Bacillus sp. REN3]|uniref:Flp pilus assembly protein CpaB n=1 Tax=Bacillus sp. REN3 TaxID=2802440 RepID=UPI001AEF19D6|nr:SAF domain-containing protein [Bacillus sp. REN3]